MPVRYSSKTPKGRKWLNKNRDGYFFNVALLPEYNPFALKAPIIPKNRDIPGIINEAPIPIKTPIKGIYLV